MSTMNCPTVGSSIAPLITWSNFDLDYMHMSEQKASSDKFLPKVPGEIYNLKFYLSALLEALVTSLCKETNSFTSAALHVMEKR
jgi:hypothetical protein